MENQVIVLPQEVVEMAKYVSEEKRNEVQSVLNKVFEGVAKMRQQLDSIVVVDANDKVNMKLSNTIRLGVREVRLDSEKVFDAKRVEVQQQMLSYKTEDALWLKSKQVMQILTKEIEENARWKEETAKRFESEKAELKVQERILIIAKFNVGIPRSEFENVSDEMFKSFVVGLEAHERTKAEAKIKEEEERDAKEKAEAEAKAAMEAENARLKEEAIAKEKLNQERIAKEEKARLATKAEFEKKLKEEKAKSDAERKAIEFKAQQEKADADAIIQAEKELNERLEFMIKTKADAEAKAKKDAEIKAALELKVKQLAEAKAAKAPKKQKLSDWVDSFGILPMPSGLGADETAIEIIEKFEAFKKWAKTKIENI